MHVDVKRASLEAAETLKSPATAAAQAPLPILIHLYWKWFLAPPGPSWLLLAPPGSSWLLLAAPSSSWLLLAPPGAFKSPRRALQEDSKASTGLSRCLFKALKRRDLRFLVFVFGFVIVRWCCFVFHCCVFVPQEKSPPSLLSAFAGL